MTSTMITTTASVVRLDFVAGCSDSNIFPPSWGGSGRIDTIRLLRPSPAVRKLMVETGLFRGEREAVGAAEDQRRKGRALGGLVHLARPFMPARRTKD